MTVFQLITNKLPPSHRLGPVYPPLVVHHVVQLYYNSSLVNFNSQSKLIDSFNNNLYNVYTCDSTTAIFVLRVYGVRDKQLSTVTSNYFAYIFTNINDIFSAVHCS